MNPLAGWTLAILAVVIGTVLYGWQGTVLGITVVVFWLLLQFSRAMRAMRSAAQSPVGQVASAVMLNAKLRPGLRMIDLVQMTRSLGEAVSDQPEVWRWHDAGGVSVRVTLVRGRVTSWQLERPDADAPAASSGAS